MKEVIKGLEEINVSIKPRYGHTMQGQGEIDKRNSHSSLRQGRINEKNPKKCQPGMER